MLNFARTAAVVRSIVFALPATLWLAEASAQSADISPRPKDQAVVSITPYLFLPITTTGESTIAGATADIDLDTSDLFDVLNFAGSARAEVGYNAFSFILDGYYVNIGGSANLPLPGPVSAKVDVSVKQGWVAMIGAYRFLEGAYDDGGAARSYAFDAGAGVRYNNLRQRIEANVDIDSGPAFRTTLGGTEAWWEPTLMLRGGVQLDDRWTAGARAEIGGFGAGGSDLHWNVLLGADYKPWDSASLKLGWQFYGIDFSTNRADGKFAYDVFQTGPYMGASFNF